PLHTIPVPHSACADTTSSSVQSVQSRTEALKPNVLLRVRQNPAAVDVTRADRLPSMTRCSSDTLLVDQTTSGPHIASRSGAAASTAHDVEFAAHDSGVHALPAVRIVNGVEPTTCRCRT